MNVHMTDTFLASDCEGIEITAESRNNSYRVIIDRKTRVPRFSSNVGPNRFGVNLMAIAMKHEKEILAYLDTPPYTFSERREKRNELADRNGMYNALADRIEKERI